MRGEEEKKIFSLQRTQHLRLEVVKKREFLMGWLSRRAMLRSLHSLSNLASMLRSLGSTVERLTLLMLSNYADRVRRWGWLSRRALLRTLSSLSNIAGMFWGGRFE